MPPESISKTYQKDFPSVDFRVVEDTHDALQKKLVRREVEMIIEQPPFTDDRIGEIPLYNDQICLLVSKGFLHNHFGEKSNEIISKLYDTGRIIQELSGCPLLLIIPVILYVRKSKRFCSPKKSNQIAELLQIT